MKQIYDTNELKAGDFVVWKRLRDNVYVDISEVLKLKNDFTQFKVIKIFGGYTFSEVEEEGDKYDVSTWDNTAWNVFLIENEKDYEQINKEVIIQELTKDIKNENN